MEIRSLLRPFGRWLKRRAENDPNRITVWVVPAKAQRTDQIELPGWAGAWAGRFLVLAVVAFCLLAVFAGVLFVRTLRTESVRRENQRLHAQIQEMEGLEKRIEEIDRFRKQLASLVGLPEEEESTDPGDRADSFASVPVSGAPGGLDLTEGAWATPLRVLPHRGPVSRGFREAVGLRRGHLGVDIAGPVGSPIRAAASGIVEVAEWDDAFGHLLVLRHADGWRTKYGHNERILVSVGDSVRAGDPVALLGNTGISSAPHLHFETVKGETAVDPAEYFIPYQDRFFEGRNGDD